MNGDVDHTSVPLERMYYISGTLFLVGVGALLLGIYYFGSRCCPQCLDNKKRKTITKHKMSKTSLTSSATKRVRSVGRRIKEKTKGKYDLRRK